MYTQTGFLGTNALLYMDIVTIYFAIYPILLYISIIFAIKKEYQKHFISQSVILFTTILMILVFEIGVRVTGGFSLFVKQSSISYDFLLIFLIVHIVIAISSLSGWLYQFIISYRAYKKNNMSLFQSNKHKRIGRYIFLALCLNSMMGVSIYIFLFIL